MSPAIDLSAFIHHDAKTGLNRLDLAVEGIDCAACIGDIERGIGRMKGVTEARLNYTNRRLGVAWQAQDVEPASIVEKLRQLGYRAHPFEASRQEQIEAAEMRFLIRCLAVSGFAAMNIMLFSVSVWSGNVTDITPDTRDMFHWLSALIALPAAAYAGQPFFRNAWRAIRNRSMTMDVPISLGILLALGMSLFETLHSAEHAYFDSAVMLLFFLLLGRVLDQVMRKKTRSVADNLMALKGETAIVLDVSGEARQVPVRAVKIGDLVLVRPGERIAVDGTVAQGRSTVDASLVTGETMQAEIGPGVPVYAGTLNIGGTLQVRVTAAHEGTLLDEVNRLVAQAADARSRYLRLADKAARIYSPIVHLAAFSTCIGWVLIGASLHDAIITAIAVLIITCPCALALAVPATQVVASGALFKAGLLLQAPDGIERAAQCDTVVFDKTGTLTLPEPRIANRASVDPELLEAAARLALSSRHPLAMALAAEAQRRVPFEHVEEVTGEGLRTIVDGVEYRLGSAAFCDAEAMAAEALGTQRDASLIAFRRDGVCAVFLLKQALRPDAVETVARLRAQNYALAILSGDNESAVAQVARALGITEWKSGLKPADKIAALDGLKRNGRRVLMVGDGLNDAPALAAAHASLSPVSAAHVAQASADALFIGEALAPVDAMLGLSRKAVRVMKDNLWIAVVYNLIAVPLAVFGHVTPLIASAAMSGSSIIVTLSALRASKPMRAALAAHPPATLVPRQEARLAS